MKYPELTLTEVSTFGIHISPYKISASNSALRSNWITDYTFRFFLEDWEGGCMVGNTLYPAKKNGFVCCKPGQTVRTVLPCRFYNLKVTTRDPALKAALDDLPTFSQHPQGEQLVALCKKLCYVDQSSTLSAQFEKYSHLYAIMDLIFRQQYPPQVARIGNARRHQQALLDANNYLRTHLSEEVDLEKLAQSSHLHPTYFHKLFTDAFGRTPAKQLMWHRITLARSYLHDDNRPISEIARLCGFSSQSHFCRKFKALTLQTPSQYRQTLRKRRQTD